MCTLHNLASINLEYLPVRDSAFLQAANLHRLTRLELRNRPELTDNIFLHLAGLVSLKHLHIRRCIHISDNLDVETLLPFLVGRLTKFCPMERKPIKTLENSQSGMFVARHHTDHHAYNHPEKPLLALSVHCLHVT